MKPDSKRTEILVGFFLFSGLLLLGGLILRFTQIRESFQERDVYYVTFKDTSGLTSASPVRLGGRQIGRVAKTPELRTDGTVVVTLDIVRDPRHRIPKGARLGIGKEGLLGDAYVGVTPPEPPIIGYLTPGDTIQGFEAGGLDSLQTAANEISEQTQIVLKDIRAGLKDLNGAITKIDRDVLAEENLNNLKKTLAGLNDVVTRVDQKILDEENAGNVRKTLAKLAETSERLAEESGKIDGLIAKGDAAFTKFGKAADSIGGAGDAFRKAAGDAGKTVGSINHGDGLMTALLHDPQLRYDFKNLVANMRERGVLFYKDKSNERPREAPQPAPKPAPAPSRRK